MNAAGKMFPSVNFLYDGDSSTDAEVAAIVSTELHSVGISIVLAPLTSQQYSAVTTTTSSDTTAYPFGINFYSEDYTASIDYVSALTTNGFIGDSGYNNQTVIGWTTAARQLLTRTP